MSLGNQRLRPNKQSNTTDSPLVSPITAQQFSDFLGLDYDASQDAILNSHLLAACDWYITHTNNELLQRPWLLELDRYPSEGESFAGLSPIAANLSPWVSIPLYPVSSIDSVEVEGEAETITYDLKSKPPRVFFTEYGEDIKINYTAGYSTAADIPQSTILGLNMMAAYLYEHSGSCDVVDAAKQSGASSIWGCNALVISL